MTLLARWLDPRPLRWLVTLVWMIFFLIVLLQPESTPLIPTGIPPGPPTPEREIFFTSMHLLGYGITTLLWWWALSGSWTARWAVGLAVLVACLLSVSTEALQTLTPDRHAQGVDLLANAAGTFIVGGYVLWHTARQTDTT